MPSRWNSVLSVWERLRERAGDWPAWKLVGAAVTMAAATGVVIALIGAHHGSPPPNARIAAAPSVSGDRPEVPAAATAAAHRFLARYLRRLPFLYGQVSAGQLHGLTPALRRSLARQRGRVTPTERARDPRVLELEFAPGDFSTALTCLRRWSATTRRVIACGCASPSATDGGRWSNCRTRPPPRRSPSR